MKIIGKIKTVFTGVLCSCVMVPVATADDIEIYTTSAAQVSASNPNIMFIVDTSLSMGVTSLVDPDYDESKGYSGDCESDGIYFTENGELPDCAGLGKGKYFKKSALVCDHATTGYDNNNDRISPPQDGTLILFGTYSDQFAQYNPNTKRWRKVDITRDDDREYNVECLMDSGNHGIDASSTRKYINNAGTDGYTSTEPADLKVPHPVWAGGSGNLQLFNGNYLNYLNTNFADADKVMMSYIDQVKAAVEIMVRGNTRVDIGLMRFDRLSKSGTAGNSEGGSINYPIIDVVADRSDFFSRLKTLDADGETPLSETYYEALLYFGGKPIDYSAKTTPSNEVASLSMKPGNREFLSPISSTCDKNYIVVLSDGNATKDNVNTKNAEGVDRLSSSILAGFNQKSCNTNVTLDDDTDDNDGAFDDIVNALVKNYSVSTTDNCLDELAGWASSNDVAVDPNVAAHKGEQLITTHAIGFAATDKNGIQLLKATAASGRGDFFTADSKGELVRIFNKIIASILQVNTTFSSPAVSVNAFNRSTHLDDLYFTLFKPGETSHWEGNLKKYKLKFEVDTADKDGDGDTTERLPFIADQLNAHAVDDNTGFFSDSAMSYWTTGVADGKEVPLGGAVDAFTTTRNVYTFTGSYKPSTNGVYEPATKDLTVAANAVDPTNASLTDALLAVPAVPEIVTGTSNRETVINWASGLDSLSQFGLVNTYTDVRPQMGDPLHAEPALVQYGGTVDKPDLVAYVATNDGYLHAINTSTGAELFSFIPQELLPNLKTAMAGAGGSKLYGLDGSVVAWINDNPDANGKYGTINAADGDHVYLYVTMRRGGRNIYALDVTDRNNPSLLWVIKGGTGDYTELGQTWSTVNVEKIKDGVDKKTVLIFGGGYDPGQDAATTTSEDSVGRTVYIADATTGERLWTAGKDAATPTATMEFSVPSRVKPLDLSGDGYIDRLYVGDMGGQIFRFDIDNVNGKALSSSITGGIIADLADASTAVANRTAANARRFYYPPDVALINAPDGTYHSIVISSGFRAHPLDSKIQDRIYVIKDRKTSLTSTYTALTEASLHNATANVAGGDAATDADRDVELSKIEKAEGWYIHLDDEANPGSWIGEKGLAEPLIIGGKAIVTTYTPNLTASADTCGPTIGIGKVYFLDVLDATPAFPSNLDARADRHIQLVRGGIPPTPNVIITKGGEPTLCIGTECGEAEFGLGVRKTYWYEVN